MVGIFPVRYVSHNQMVVETPQEALAKNPVVRREPFGAMGDPYGDFMVILREFLINLGKL